jgi:hypothetical protein
MKRILALAAAIAAALPVVAKFDASKLPPAWDKKGVTFEKDIEPCSNAPASSATARSRRGIRWIPSRPPSRAARTAPAWEATAARAPSSPASRGSSTKPCSRGQGPGLQQGGGRPAARLDRPGRHNRHPFRRGRHRSAFHRRQGSNPSGGSVSRSPSSGEARPICGP